MRIPRLNRNRLVVIEDLTKLCKDGELHEALRNVELMQQQGIVITKNVAYYLLEKCEKKRDLGYGRRVWSLMLHNGLESIAILGDHLIRLFAYHSCCCEANSIFNKIIAPTEYTWAAITLANAKGCVISTALELHYRVQLFCVQDNKYISVSILKACSISGSLVQGRIIHALIFECGFQSDLILGNNLIDMYAKCESLEEAERVFANLQRDLVSWNSMLSGYAQYGDSKVLEYFEGIQLDGLKPNLISWGTVIAGFSQHGKELLAIQYYKKMQGKGIEPDRGIFLCVLNACAIIGAIHEGKFAHSTIIQSRLEVEGVLANTLFDMYARCGDLPEAEKVFEALLNKDVDSWNALMAGYAQQREDVLALRAFSKMQEQGITPNHVTYLTALKACTSIRDMNTGRDIHDKVIQAALKSDSILASVLVDMYVKCGKIEEACKVFNSLHKLDIVIWGVMISGFTRHNYGVLAFECFEKMEQEGMRPNMILYSNALQACINTRETEKGRLIHEHILASELHLDDMVGSILVDLYVKCGSLYDASISFNKLLNRDTVSWSAIITGYVQHEEACTALEYFRDMQQEGIKPNGFLFSSVLKACGSMGAVKQGRIIHEYIIDTGLLDAFIGSALINMYTKSDSLEEASKVFDQLVDRDVACWAAIITGYVQLGEFSSAINYFEKMQQESIKPNGVAFLVALKACASIRDIERGRLIHEQVKDSIQLDVAIGNVLIYLYAECGSLKEACNVFKNLQSQNVVSWGAMIAGYVQHGEDLQALRTFEQMQLMCMNADKIMFSSLLKACASLGALEQGRHIHDMIIQSGIHADASIGTSLIEMYAKCGSLNEAHRVFAGLLNRDDVCWSIMIACYAEYGEGVLALGVFLNMQQNGIEPNEVAFTSILIACSRTGLVEEGCWYFRCLRRSRRVMPTVFHFSCIIDLLGRAGSFSEAENLLRSTEQINILGWTALLSSCRVHYNVELGTRCFEEIKLLSC